jgi:hypothetical protein
MSCMRTISPLHEDTSLVKYLAFLSLPFFAAYVRIHSQPRLYVEWKTLIHRYLSTL